MPDFDLSGTEPFVEMIANAPQVSAVTMEAGNSMPNDRPNFDPDAAVMPVNTGTPTPSYNNEFMPGGA